MSARESVETVDMSDVSSFLNGDCRHGIMAILLGYPVDETVCKVHRTRCERELYAQLVRLEWYGKLGTRIEIHPIDNAPPYQADHARFAAAS